jgi:putative hemolysin
MEQTTAYVALENFKKLEYIMLLFQIAFFKGNYAKWYSGSLSWWCFWFYKDDFQLIEREDGSWLVDGIIRCMIFDLLWIRWNNYEVTTVSGLIMTELSHIPKQGEKLIWQKIWIRSSIWMAWRLIKWWWKP